MTKMEENGNFKSSTINCLDANWLNNIIMLKFKRRYLIALAMSSKRNDSREQRCNVFVILLFSCQHVQLFVENFRVNTRKENFQMS